VQVPIRSHYAWHDLCLF